MPRSGSVGGGNDDSNTSYHEQYHAGSPAQSGREIEAVERQIEVQEVACPDGYGIENVQRRMLDIADGQAAQPDVFQHTPHFRKMVRLRTSQHSKISAAAMQTRVM